MQYVDSIMYGFYFIAFIEYILGGNTLNDYNKDGKIICKHFKDKYGKIKPKL